MRSKETIKQLRNDCYNKAEFLPETLNWISDENLWNIWVPKQYGGLEKTFSEGLKTLQNLAEIDGSLGWTITLCSGANYFIGNLHPSTAKEIFNSNNKPIFGGSGGIFGTAEKQKNGYTINGKWLYATGAPYLTHFTLNAKIIENGEVLKDKDGKDEFLSFVLPKEKVEYIEDWQTMGLKATTTDSFIVDQVFIDEKYSFKYNKSHLPQTIFKIPFSLFADLTTWVNYLGMLKHYYDAAQPHLEESYLKNLTQLISQTQSVIFDAANFVENELKNGKIIEEDYLKMIHDSAVDLIRKSSQAIIELHPRLGIKACRIDHQLNQIFRDYFTATQHRIFVAQ